MQDTGDLFEIVQQLRDKIDGKERDERFNSFMGQHGKKWKDDRGIGLRVFNELEERGVDVSAADEVLQKMLEGIREESIAQKKVIEDLLDKIEAVSDSVSKVLNEENKVAETNTPMPSPDPNAIPQSIPPGGPGAPMPDAGATSGGLSAPPPGAPPAAPPPDAGAMGGAPPAAPPPVPSDIDVKTNVEPTPDEATDDVIPDEGIEDDDDLLDDDGVGYELTPEDVQLLQQIIGQIEGDESEDETEEEVIADDFYDPLGEEKGPSVEDLFNEDEVDEDMGDDDVLKFLTK